MSERQGKKVFPWGSINVAGKILKLKYKKPGNFKKPVQPRVFYLWIQRDMLPALVNYSFHSLILAGSEDKKQSDVVKKLSRLEKSLQAEV